MPTQKYSYCPRYGAVLVSRGDVDNLVYRTRCKTWTCVYCADVNRKIWQARIINHLKETQDEWWFVTFTLRPEDHSGLLGSLLKWREIWDRLMKRIRRMVVGKLHYIRVFEQHRDGTLHAHMLINYAPDDLEERKFYNKRTGKTDKNWQSKTLDAHLSELGLGYVYDWQPVTRDDYKSSEDKAVRLSGYITKYLTKQNVSIIEQVSKNEGLRIRSIQTSQGWWNFEKSIPDREWEIGLLKFDEFTESEEIGVYSYDVNNNSGISEEDFHGETHYPNKYSDLVDMAKMMQNE